MICSRGRGPCSGANGHALGVERSSEDLSTGNDLPSTSHPPHSTSPAFTDREQLEDQRLDKGYTNSNKVEMAAVRRLLSVLPRGYFRSGSTRAVDEAVTTESWKLLTTALSRQRKVAGETGINGDDDRDDGAEHGGGTALEPKDFPLLLSSRVHAAVVGGLAANLLDVEVRSTRMSISSHQEVEGWVHRACT